MAATTTTTTRAKSTESKKKGKTIWPKSVLDGLVNLKLCDQMFSFNALPKKDDIFCVPNILALGFFFCCGK